MTRNLFGSVLSALPAGALIRLSRLLPSPLAYRLEFAADAASWAPRATFNAAVPFGRARISSSLEEHNDRRFALHWTNSLAGLATASVVVQPGDTVFELGANVGTETLALSALAGSGGRVVAVEPSDHCAATVARRVAANCIENVTLVRAAVAAASGSVGFEEGTAVNSGVGHVSDWNRETKPGAIEAITLDSLQVHGLPSFVFMDIEGAECQALLGGAETLTRVRPVIFAEVNGPALRRMGNSVAEFCEVAARHRYLMFDANARGQPAFQADSRGETFTDVILLPQEQEATIHAIRRRIRLYKLFPWLLGRQRRHAAVGPQRRTEPTGDARSNSPVNASTDEGILYVAFGERWRAEAKDSIRSLRRVSTLPVAVVTDAPWLDEPQPDVFVERRDSGGFCVKPRHIFDATPFARTLFLDTDTRVLQDPAPVFGLLQHYDIGVRFGGPQLNEEPGLMFHAQCNSGVVLFRRCEAVTQVGQLWLQEYDRGLALHGQGDDPRGLGDQRYLAIAIAKSRARPVHLAEYMNFALFESIVAYSPLVVVHGHQRDIDLIGEEINARWDPRRDWHARVWLSNIEGLLPAGIRRSDPLLALALLLRRAANRLRRRLLARR